VSSRYDPEVEALLRGEDAPAASKPAQQTQARRRRLLSLPLIVGALALALAGVFLYQNRTATEVTFFLWSAGVSLVWALLASSALGAILGFALGWRVRRRPMRQK